jgi:hypothetical protein
MTKPTLSKKRVVAAYAVAVVADLLELPITYIESFHFEITFLLGQGMDIVLDFIVMGIMTYLLGFNWVFLPSFFVEVIPELDMCPSWVASVAFVVWQQKKKEVGLKQSLPLYSTPDETAVEVVSEPTSVRRIGPPPAFEPSGDAAQMATPDESQAEQRLKRLADLLDKNLISQSEYELKRQQILCEI